MTALSDYLTAISDAVDITVRNVSTELKNQVYASYGVKNHGRYENDTTPFSIGDGGWDNSVIELHPTLWMPLPEFPVD
jgi:hypothetical protein